MASEVKERFMAEFQSLIMAASQCVEGLAISDGEEFERLARRAAVIIDGPARRLISATNEMERLHIGDRQDG